jgi:microcystin-dependent protein
MGVQVEDLVFEIRDASLNRVAQLLPTDGLTTFKATLRFNNVGTWEISIPEVSPRADLLRTPGYGLIVTGPGGVVWLSGPTVAATSTRDMGLPYGEWAIRGATDSILLGEHLAYPTPGSANVAAQTSAYDTRTGVASTLMYGYVTRNLVSGTAPAARVVTGLTCATDTAIGSSLSFSARFDNLGELLSSLANVSSPQLGFDVKQSGAGLQFAVYQPTDRTGTIRMDTDNKTLQKATYGYGYGKTRAIVGGNGEGTARQFVEVASSSAESTWARRVEAFVDQRQESDSTKLTQAGTDLLNQSGGTITSMDVVPTNDTTMTYGTDFYLGDKVTVAVAAQQVTGIVSTVQVSIAEDGVRVGCTIGNPVGFDYEAVLSKRQTDTTAGVSKLQRVEAVQGTLVPAAGLTGQALVKTSDTDYATAWGQVTSAGIADGSVTATKIASTVTSLVPTGSVFQWITAVAPTGYLLCDGTAVSRTTYATLWNTLRAGTSSSPYGNGDGSTTFNLPDLRGRVPVGQSVSGTFATLGTSGGAETHTLTAAQMPAHTHKFGYRGGTSAQGNSPYVVGTSITHDPANQFSDTSSAGSGAAHNNLQPYLVTNHIIKT